jgi:hypothetical protein
MESKVQKAAKSAAETSLERHWGKRRVSVDLTCIKSAEPGPEIWNCTATSQGRTLRCDVTVGMDREIDQTNCGPLPRPPS